MEKKIQTCERKYAFESKYLNTYKVLKFSETHGRLDGKVIQQNWAQPRKIEKHWIAEGCKMQDFLFKYWYFSHPGIKNVTLVYSQLCHQQQTWTFYICSEVATPDSLINLSWCGFWGN